MYTVQHREKTFETTTKNEDLFLYHQCKTKVTSPLPPLQKQWRSCWLMRYINLHDLPTYFNLFYLGVCDLPPPSRWLITEINIHQYCKTYLYP